MIDVAISVSEASDERTGFSATIRVSANLRSEQKGWVAGEDRERLGDGPLLPDGGVGNPIREISSVTLNLRRRRWHETADAELSCD